MNLHQMPLSKALIERSMFVVQRASSCITWLLSGYQFREDGIFHPSGACLVIRYRLRALFEGMAREPAHDLHTTLR